MRSRLAAVAFATAALALGACGGDDSGGERASSRDGSPAAERTDTTGGGETTQTRTERQGAQEAVPELELEEGQEPVPKDSVPPDERTGRPSTYDRARPLTKEQLKAIERPIYEQARYFCNRVGVEVLRREYRVESSDPEDVAREAARRTYQREARDAVFSGCLAGLRAGD